MENVIGKAKDYLEERGIDTKNMTLEEILKKYQELIFEDNSQEAVDEDKEEVVEETAENSEIDSFLTENKEVIDTLNEEQTEVFNKLVEIARK